MKKLAIAGLAAVTLAGCSDQQEEAQVLNLYNWSEYMPQEVLDRFEEETGIQVVYTTYDSNEAMYARLKLLDDSSQYDLAVPSTYYVNKMRKEDLLMEIDHSQIEGFDNLIRSWSTRASTRTTPIPCLTSGAPPAWPSTVMRWKRAK